jgi:hypothetical protein
MQLTNTTPLQNNLLKIENSAKDFLRSVVAAVISLNNSCRTGTKENDMLNECGRGEARIANRTLLRRGLGQAGIARLVLGTSLGVAGVTCGAVEPIAEYRLGSGMPQITYAAGPVTLPDAADKGHALTRTGNPRFVASAPSIPAARGAGAMEFDGESAAYVRDGALFGPTDRFGMEVWVAAGEADAQGLKGVMANGTGAQGYVIGQSGGQWVVFVGSVGAFPIGPVEPGRWTHLALVHDGTALTAYRDGEPIRTVPPSAAVAPFFRIGTAGLPDEHFKGRIHQARVFTFAAGAFSSDTDFTLDNEHRQQVRQRHREERGAFIRELSAARPGVTVVEALSTPAAADDWLITPPDQPVELQVQPAADGQSARLALHNGLIARSFYVGPDLACYSYRNLRTDAELLRAVKPEMRVKLDGVWYDVGGLVGEPIRSYFIEDWLKGMRADPTRFQFKGLTTGAPVARYPWTPKFNAPAVPWPPKGMRVSMHYAAPPAVVERHGELRLSVHYEMYQGLPVMSKSFTLENASGEPVRVDEIETEILAVSEDQVRRLHVESNYSFHLANHSPMDAHATGDHSSPVREDAPLHFAGRTTTQWRLDPEYDTWGHPAAIEDTFRGHLFRNLLVSRIPMGPAQRVAPGGRFESHITFLLAQDSTDTERQSLGVRRMYRALCPQVNESLLHATTPSHDPVVIKKLIDQMAEIGFEMFTVGFWPGISHDNLDPDYVAKWKDIVDYARERDVMVSGYELMVASRGRGAEHDVVDPATGQPGCPFGQSLCLGSAWAEDYFKRVWSFIDQTGFMSIAVDGPFHGDPCASTTHKNHEGMEDSQWVQWQIQNRMFEEEQRRNMYAPAPDWYFWNGQVSVGMGYREASANLPRELKATLYRQYLYDGTWYKAPTMGDVSISLIGTYTDDPGAMLEPLEQNLHWYERKLSQTLAVGCQISLRANRLYDTDKTRAMVKKWVDWFKKYRGILTSDIIHVIRPSGRDIDVMMHVNPSLDEKGLAVFFNPLTTEMTRTVRLPLYYTGLTDAAVIREQDQGPAKRYELARDYSVEVEITLPPLGMTWLVIRAEVE